MPRFWFSWYSVTCAEERLQNASTAAAHAVSFSCCLCMSPSLEIEVKAGHQAAGGYIGPVGRPAALANPRVFVVPCETSAAGHERHITEAEDVVINIAEVGGSPGNRLLRHPHPLRTLDKDELRILHPVCFYERAIP